MKLSIEEALPLLTTGRLFRTERSTSTTAITEPWFTVEHEPVFHSPCWFVYVREIHASVIILPGATVEVADDFDVEDLL